MALNFGQRRHQREETAPSRLLAIDLKINKRQRTGCSEGRVLKCLSPMAILEAVFSVTVDLQLCLSENIFYSHCF